MWETAANLAKPTTTRRRAAELAIAVDGLTDRCCNELGSSKAYIRKSVTALCVWPGTSLPRPDCIERVRGVANAYKHENLTDKTLPITSASDVLVVALGYGLDAFGVGKYSGVEVIVRDKAGQSWKFLGDAPTAVVGWFPFRSRRGLAVRPLLCLWTSGGSLNAAVQKSKILHERRPVETAVVSSRKKSGAQWETPRPARNGDFRAILLISRRLMWEAL
jgi:hypothetical protein